MSPSCSSNGCYCDQSCHNWNDCCSDIADIGCHPASIYSPIASPTPSDIPHITPGKLPLRIPIIANNKVIKSLYFYIVKS